jgi:hypothetical protein
VKGKSPPVPSIHWSAWCRRTVRAPWRCVVRCATSKGHALALLHTLTRGQFVEAAALPAGQLPGCAGGGEVRYHGTP